MNLVVLYVFLRVSAVCSGSFSLFDTQERETASRGMWLFLPCPFVFAGLFENKEADIGQVFGLR